MLFRSVSQSRYTRRWDKKYGDALINVGREKAKGRYGGTPNISRGVSAARKLEK